MYLQLNAAFQHDQEKLKKNIKCYTEASFLQYVLLQQKWQQEHDTSDKPSLCGKQSAPASMDDRLQRKSILPVKLFR